tara:strand:- start:9853 stop:10968 length:1116 start_codon:yes stop_codon:yes gene_type:complete
LSGQSIVFICGNGDTLYRFRFELIKSLIKKNFTVHAFAPEIPEDFLEELKSSGVIYHNISFKRKTVNFFDTFVSIFDITKKLRAIKPDIVFSYTHKSVVVGSISAFLAGRLRSISLITGTGHIFDNHSITQRIKRFLGILGFKISLFFSEIVFFQNPDDLELFCSLGMTSKSKSILLNGSGVDLEKFYLSPLPEDPVFLCMSRLIKSKGLLDYANAAKIVKSSYPNARFLLYGFPDDHEDSIDESEIIETWKARYGIEYFGFTNDPVKTISLCSVYVLLSYNEGTPRSVLEAMAMGRPIITTDVPGCRETVMEDKNGILANLRDPNSAAQAMISLLDGDLRKKMSINSRRLCEEKYDVHLVNELIMSSLKI